MKALVIGAGAAGMAAACRLAAGGAEVTAVCEGRGAGTSRGAGSDKQTYYRVATAGAPDNVRGAAEALFSGGAMHGEHALVEAALSQRCFFYLAEAGVPFPEDEYGQFPGYRTDHDERPRGASAGPLTSRFMAECLEKKALSLGVRFHEGLRAAALLVWQGRVRGAFCMDRRGRGHVEAADAVVLATGGPGALFPQSVYPKGQVGALGLGLEAGARGQNLAEWQFGLASLDVRWNLSGTYQQALPRYVAVDSSGREEERPFDENVFLKGYQWPFDARKAQNGSSRVDLWVTERRRAGMEVFLDFTRNPEGFSWERLTPEARGYLESSGARQETPFERLRWMNPGAAALYQSHGIGLSRDWLRIGVCAQHHNGGLCVDEHWQTTLPGLYAVGEAAGTHGICRPGGSALNAGQAGALRAAEAILGQESLSAVGEEALAAGNAERIERALFCRAEDGVPAGEAWQTLWAEMDARAGMFRDGTPYAAQPIPRIRCDDAFEALAIRDLTIAGNAVRAAVCEGVRDGVGSRGSSLCFEQDGAVRMDDGAHDGLVLETEYGGGACPCRWTPRRPLPEADLWFERVWRGYRQRKGL